MNDEIRPPEADSDYSRAPSSSIGALNMALLFGTAAIALSLIVTPMLAPSKDDPMQASTMDYDNITTGSIPTSDGKTKHYTIRRSILSENPGDVCIIDSAGHSKGC